MRRQFLDMHDVALGDIHELPIFLTFYCLVPVVDLRRWNTRPRSLLIKVPWFRSSLSSFRDARDRLAVCAYEIFQCVPNRRLVYKLVITESNVITHIFDHVGAAVSTPLLSLTMLEGFTALILGLASDGERIELDKTVWRRLDDDQKVIVITMESVKNELIHFLLK